MGVLRVLLATAVVFHHSYVPWGMRMTGGRASVEAFFLVSGFLMALAFDRVYRDKSLRSFYLNRFLRLYPLYWLVLFLTIARGVGGYLLLGISPMHYWLYPDVALGWATKAYFLLTNILLVGQDTLLFMSVHPQTGKLLFTLPYVPDSIRASNWLMMPQAWSLSLEICFYALVPWLARFSTRRLVAVVASCLILRSIFYYPFCTEATLPDAFFPFELAFFCGGMVAYRAYQVLTAREFFEKYSKAALGAFAVAVLAVVFFDKVFEPWGPGGYWAFYGSLCLALPGVFHFSKNSQWDSHLGEFSYPIYITHFLVLMTISSRFRFFEDENAWALSILAITVGLSAVLMRAVKPIERWRSQVRSSRQPAVGSIPSFSGTVPTLTADGIRT